MDLIRIFILSFSVLTFAVLATAQPPTDTLNTTVFIKKNLFYPVELTLVDDWLFVKDMSKNTGEFSIKVFDINRKEKVYEFITKGKGPGEYLNFDIRRGPGNGTLEISDSQNRKNDIYELDCLKRKPEPENIETCIAKTVVNASSKEAIVIENKSVINTGSNMKGILFISKNGSITRYLTSIPDNILEQYQNNAKFATMAMTGYLTSDPFRNHFAFFAQFYDQYHFLTKNGTGLIVQHSNKATYTPQFDVFGSGGSVALKPSDKAKFAFLKPTATEKYVYVPWSGKTNSDLSVVEDNIERRASANRIFVYNWSGKKVNELILPKHVFHVEISQDEKNLYSIYYDEKLTPFILKSDLR